jgi:ATP synthase protein I
MRERNPARGAGLPPSTQKLLREVAAREARMIRRGREGAPNLWRSVGLMGLVGWSVVLPMLVGIAVGLWIDREWPSRFSWTLMLLVGGLAAGCVNAWGRIKREQEDR